MGEIKKLSQLDDNLVTQAIDVFVEGFYKHFSSVTKDKIKLRNIFKSSFDYDMTYAYIENGTANGFLGIRTYEKHPIALNKAVFLDEINGAGGKITYAVINNSFKKVTPANPNEIYIDYLATAPARRGSGIGTKLIEYAREASNGKQLMIEVFLKNTGAKKLYERLGFKVIKTKLSFTMMILGLGRLATMKLE